MSILALLDESPSYGLQLRNEFEARTGSIWPLNVGQVYTTLSRLERDGFVTQTNDSDEKTYEITAAGRAHLREWFSTPSANATPSRDELVLKIVMAAAQGGVDPAGVIQAERKAAVQLLQEYTRLKRDTDDETDIGWQFMLDSLIFQTEARVRWLDACEERLQRRKIGRAPRTGTLEKGTQKEKVRR